MLLNDDEEYRIVLGDCIEHIRSMPSHSVDCSIFSPPFLHLYAYNDSASDIGNTDDTGESKLHLSFFFKAMLRIIKPGRPMLVHCSYVPRMKRAGGQGLIDFPGMLIRLGERAGFFWEYTWAIRRNPQAQAIRSKSRELQFSGLEADRAKSRGAIPDFILKFVAPGENQVRIDSEDQVSRNQWIDLAEYCWTNIKETDTLNVREAKGPNDTKHVCVARNSLILTRDGYKPIQDVEIGSLVLTHLGRWKPVIAKACNGDKDTIQVEAQGVAKLVTTPDHKFWTRQCCGRGGKGWNPGSMEPSRHKRNAITSVPEWIDATDTLGSYVNLPLPSIEESPYTPKEWWIIGRWLGDGHLDSRGAAHITCSFKETESLIASLGDCSGFVHNTQTASQIRLKDRNDKLRSVLRRCGRGAANKCLPSEAFSMNHECSESLLSGYLSSDGHYVRRYQRWTASSVSRSLLLGMAMIAQRARGVVASVYAGKPPGEYCIGGRTGATRQGWVLSIPPKNLSAFLADDGGWKKVRRITDRESREVWDLQVADDQSFVVEGCVVHNCALQLGVISPLVKLFSNPSEIIFSPFCGVGSEIYMALKLGRRGYGIELKPEYQAVAVKNCEKAIKQRKESERTLFDMVPAC